MDDRRIISGILHVLKSGCRWCDCPPEYGPPTTIYNCFVRWAEHGVWERLFRELAGSCLLLKTDSPHFWRSFRRSGQILQTTAPHRECHLSVQGLPPYRHPLRQDGWQIAWSGGCLIHMQLAHEGPFHRTPAPNPEPSVDSAAGEAGHDPGPT